jgi:hypothetical protein
MNYAVMCCGCGRMMNKDGKPGVVLLDVQTGIMNYIGRDEDVAEFEMPEEADSAATANGWSVHDTKGPNHRCPSCAEKEKGEPRLERRGAYIPWSLGAPAYLEETA